MQRKNIQLDAFFDRYATYWWPNFTKYANRGEIGRRQTNLGPQDRLELLVVEKIRELEITDLELMRVVVLV